MTIVDTLHGSTELCRTLNANQLSVRTMVSILKAWYFWCKAEDEPAVYCRDTDGFIKPAIVYSDVKAEQGSIHTPLFMPLL